MQTLRPYQSEMVDAVFSEWESNQSTLLVAATGLGKTSVASEIILRAQPKRACVLVHREELVWQARNRIETHAGVECQVEMAHLSAGTGWFNRAPVLIGTIQTMMSGNGKKRMERFNPADFDIVVADEAHHFAAPSFRKVLSHFQRNPNLKIAGLTATPDRFDEKALGEVFQSVAYEMDILDGIHGGWLVPIEQHMVNIQGLDFSHIRTTAGDLNGADLAAVMEAEKAMQGVAAATLDICGNKKTLVFTASVRQAEMLCNIFNRHRSNMASWVCGKTPKDERRQRLKDFEEGRFQIITNCAVLGEGWDSPQVELVVQAKPTKSRCVYAQSIGRGLRSLPGVIDGIDTDDGRRSAIAASKKPTCTVLDFCGNAGRHKLICTADILGGKHSDEAVERARNVAAKSKAAVSMVEVIEEEERKIKQEQERRRMAEEARKARLVAKVKYTTKKINPFDAFDIEPCRPRGWDDGKHFSEKERNLLMQHCDVNPDTITYSQGRQLIVELFRRWKNNLASMKQCNVLKKHGRKDTKNMPRERASQLIDELAKNRWRAPESWGGSNEIF